MRVTQKEIARRLGVNQSTVSYVLGGRARAKKISDRLAARIRAFAARAEYQVNHVARSLLTGKSNCLAFYMPALEDSPRYIWSRTLEGVVEAANAREYRVTIHGMGDGAWAEGARLFKGGLIDGALFFGASWDSLPAKQDTPKYPALFIEWQSQRPDTPVPPGLAHLRTTSKPGIEAAVAHLRDLGHRTITYVQPVHQPGQFFERLEFARAACQRLGMRCRTVLFEYGLENYRLPIGEQVARFAKLLENEIPPGSPSTAVMAWNDQVALAVCQVAQKKGLRIPEDLSVVGYDNFFAEVLSPPLTTIDYQGEILGRRAVEILFDRINRGKKTRPEEVPTKLVVRFSTAPARR